MSKRFYTADFHLGMSDIIRFENRPFSNADEMNIALISNCCQTAKKDDIIVHLGDLASFKMDRGNKGLDMKPADMIAAIPATFINVRGNHDLNNKVKSFCSSFRTKLGKRFVSVSASHYPSYDERAKDQFLDGDIHLCGHVHGKWKHCLDLTHSVLNINVGIDVWNYKIVSELELIKYIDELLKLPKEQINKIKI